MNTFKIVLYSPDIPGNTGSIGRTCLALGAELILIKPYGFDLSEKAVRRAGLDYWRHVQLKEYENWKDFIFQENPDNEKLIFFTTKTKKVYYQAHYTPDCYLIFGPETKGLPQNILETYPQGLATFPMFSGEIRSLNLANCATAAGYECLRQINYINK